MHLKQLYGGVIPDRGVVIPGYTKHKEKWMMLLLGYDNGLCYVDRDPSTRVLCYFLLAM